MLTFILCLISFIVNMILFLIMAIAVENKIMQIVFILLIIVCLFMSYLTVGEILKIYLK